MRAVNIGSRKNLNSSVMSQILDFHWSSPRWFFCWKSTLSIKLLYWGRIAVTLWLKARSHMSMNKWLASYRENNRINNRNNSSSPSKTATFFSRGLVELQLSELLQYDLHSNYSFYICCSKFIVNQTLFVYLVFLARIPPDPTVFEKCCMSSQGCLLLLYLKQHLKELYGFSDR